MVSFLKHAAPVLKASVTRKSARTASLWSRSGIDHTISKSPIVQQARSSAILNDSSSVPTTATLNPRNDQLGSSHRSPNAPARANMSTLNLDHSQLVLDDSDTLKDDQPDSGTDESQAQSQRRGRSNQRKLVLVCTILLVPILGRDVLEAVLPGMIGVILFSAGMVRDSLRWIRGIGKT